MATLLVAGLNEHDSGKTWLGYALAKLLRRRGRRVAAYKPVGGFNAWHSYAAFKESMKKGVLAGGDALLYHRVTGQELWRINPLALLLAPPDPLAFSGPASYAAAYMDVARLLALARVTPCGGRSLVYFFPGNLEHVPARLRGELLEAARSLGAETASARKFLEWMQSAEASELLERCRAQLLHSADEIIIESFNDAVLPYSGLDTSSIDFYIVVAPGVAMVYSGDRLRVALEALGVPSRVQRLLPALGRPLHAEPLPPARSPEELAEKLGETELARLFA